MSNLIFDIRYAVRSLSRSPAFMAVALTTLILGIGATTAILSVVDGVLLRGLPYPHADRLVAIGGVFANDPDDIGPLSVGNLHDLRASTPSIETFVAASGVSMTLLGDAEPELIRVAEVTEGFIELFGVGLAAGRGFAAEDHAVGAPRVAIVEHGFWVSRWGGDPAVVGSSITLNNEPFLIVGVAVADFVAPEAVGSLGQARMWVPWPVDWQEAPDRSGFRYQAIGRLAPGFTAASASDQVDAVFRQASRENHPDFEVGGGVVPLHDRTLGTVGEPLRLLLMASGFLLLIACANVANLMLARGTARGREIAVRASLGAGRGRIARQLLTESSMLALIAGGGGAVTAQWSLELFRAVSPGGIPRLAEVSVDLRVLGLALLLSTATGVLFGLAPVLQLWRADIVTALKEGRGSSAPGAARSRARSGIVVAEVALALVLLVGAGLLLNSFVQLTRVDAGFSPGGLISMRVNLRSAYPDGATWTPFFVDLLDRVRAIPGVASASLTTSLPFSGVGIVSRMTPEDGDTAEPTYVPSTYASSGHFRNLGMQLLEGRDFDARDHADSPGVVIISDVLLRQFWPQATSGLGRRIKMGALDDEDPSLEVIGVVGALRYRPDQSQLAEVYLPVSQGAWRSMDVVARAADRPGDLAPLLREAVWSIDPDLPVDRVATIDELASVAVVQPRFYSMLAGAFALVALMLALIGIYGTMSYTVGLRTHEMGIRMALGAARGNVVGLIVGSGVRIAALGIGLGLAAALALMRLLGRFLFGVSATDLPTFAAAATLFVVTAGVACYLPARRAAALDPVRALQNDA